MDKVAVAGLRTAHAARRHTALACTGLCVTLQHGGNVAGLRRLHMSDGVLLLMLFLTYLSQVGLPSLIGLASPGRACACFESCVHHHSHAKLNKTRVSFQGMHRSNQSSGTDTLTEPALDECAEAGPFHVGTVTEH